MKNENEVCTLYMYEMQDLIKSSTSKPGVDLRILNSVSKMRQKNMVDKFIIKIV